MGRRGGSAGQNAGMKRTKPPQSKSVVSKPPQTPRAASQAEKSTPAATADAPASPPQEKPSKKSVWGRADSGGDWIPVPRALLYLGSFDDETAKKLEPRHILLALCFVAKKYKEKKTRRLWYYLAKDLGFERDTVRKWAYQLEDMGLLKIKRYKDKSSGIARAKPGYRNESNEFDISPFIAFVERAYDARVSKKKERKDKQGGKAEKEGGT